ncbi:MAG TPA: sialidase family protein [Ktedonobacterales bacterium]|nr:sialidase family protein [Ktedonobacterales bacterium]
MWRKPLFITTSVMVFVALIVSAIAMVGARGASADSTTYDITTLAGKVASVNGTAGLQIRFSAFIEQEADESGAIAPFGPGITPANVLSSPLDGNSVLAPDVTVNQDTAGAPQNETAIAVDPNNPNRVVASANDYVTRTWTCKISGTPCSALGDGYSGTYFSNDGGAHWCCSSALDGSNQGTLIPGVDHLSGGQYDAGGDPALAFDSHGNVYYAGLGFDRTAPPNTVAVNRGTFPTGHLTWGQPTFINQTTSPSTLNDKEWIGADHFAGSPFRDRVYVTFTRFIFNPINGRYVESPIMEAHSSDGGATFSAPQAIGGAVHYDQGSRPVIGPDGTVYVFFEGSTRIGPNSTYVVKSSDGGATWSKPVAIALLADVSPLANTAFRVNSFPAADINPVTGTLYATWSSETDNATGGLCASSSCHAATFFATSSDGGNTWSAPALIFPGLDSQTRTAMGPYPVAQPNPCIVAGTPTPCPALTPNTRRVDTLWPSVAVSPDGSHVYMSAYAADVVSPWQTCVTSKAQTALGASGRINCLALGNYINNARLDYAVRDLATNSGEKIVTTNPINTRNGFGGGFIGDYTDIAVGSDNAYHALWTDTNNKQTVVWFYGFQFVPTPINQEDVVTASGTI